jgi:hypothetical protein
VAGGRLQLLRIRLAKRLAVPVRTPYADQRVVVIWPDGIVAGHIALGETRSAIEFLQRCLPLA